MRFSVIMPLYNKAPYVAKAIGSVLNQAYTDYELVIMDDGSTDDSYTVASQAIEGKDSCHIYKQKNAGVSMARNNAVALSRGDYICFLDADDWWAANFLERMDQLIKDYPEAGIYGTNYYYVKNGRQRICVTTAETGYINYCRAFAAKLQMPLWTGATCIPRIIFNKFEGFRPHISIGEDFDLWIKVAMKYKVAFLDEPLSFYFQDSDATWRLVSKLHEPKSNVLWNLDYLEEEEKHNPDYKVLIDSLRANGLISYYLSKRYRDAARKELAKVDWSIQPSSLRALYKKPIWYVKSMRRIRRAGSVIKQRLSAYLNRHLSNGHEFSR